MYNIKHTQGKYIALRDVIANIFKNPFHFLSTKAKSAVGIETKEKFWALKGVNFEIQKGEVVGVIGRNGAGKSTLLKILTSITPPTEGEVIMRGHVASLLEVGTGFHPELSGRENIFLNGAILGMSRKDIVKHFDEIVAFAGVEKFLDTPVKYYSSGMYVRLAFSVAAHMEPDILLVDEVLAVGDIEFQKKCLGKMEDVTSKQGRTILFVSHNMAAIQSLCPKTILIEKGQVKAFGPTEEVVAQYMHNSISSTTKTWEDGKRPGDATAKISSVRLINEKRENVPFAYTTQQVGVEIAYEVLRESFMPIPNIHVYTGRGEYAFISHADLSDKIPRIGKHIATVWIPANLLNEGTYVIGAAITTMRPLMIHAHEREALVFDVVEDVIGDKQSDFNHRIPGVVRPLLTWEVK